jgi:hypothetical protein
MAQKLTFEDIKFIEKQFNLGLRPKAIIESCKPMSTAVVRKYIGLLKKS